MNQGKLQIALIYGTGSAIAAIPELFNSLPQVNVSEQWLGASEFLGRPEGTPLDTMMVYLEGLSDPPEWIEELSLKFPQAPLLLCSERVDREFLLRAMHLGVREVLPLPLAPAEVQAVLDRLRSSRLRLGGPAQSTVVAVTGQKGGVGTTAVAINLAMALAEQQGECCALVDLGRPFPDIANFLDQVPTHDLSDAIHNISDLDQSFFEKIMQPYENRLAILHGISDFREQDNLETEAVDKIFRILRGLHKHIVVDLGHLFDDLFFQVFKEADLVLMLIDLNVPNFRNLKKFWPLITEGDPQHQRVKLVVNRQEKDDDLGMAELVKVLQEQPYAILPSDDHHLRESINRGLPLEKWAPHSKLYLRIRELAQKIIQSYSGDEQSAKAAHSRRRFWLF